MPMPRIPRLGKPNEQLERVLSSAKAHGEESDPDHEVGDLQDFCRILWKFVSIANRNRAIEEYFDSHIDETEDEDVYTE